MKQNTNTMPINAYVVYYLRNGQRTQKLANSRVEANRMKDSIINRQHRKFLGLRPVTLVEV